MNMLVPQPTREYLLAVQEGLIPNRSIVSKYGENPSISIIDGFEDITDLGGVYVAPTQSRIHDIVSTDAADTGTLLSTGTATFEAAFTLIDSSATFIADGVDVGDIVLNDTKCTFGAVTAVQSETILIIASKMRSPMDAVVVPPNEVDDVYRVVTSASTGAAVMFVEGLGTTLLETFEFVILNGLTDVPTLNSYFRQFRAKVLGQDPNTGAVGVVTSTAQTDLTVSCQIIDGNNQTLMAVYTVPLNKKGYIFNWWGSLSKKQTGASNIRLRAGSINGFGYIQRSRAITAAGSSSFDKPLPYLPVGGGVDIWCEADAGSNDMGIASGFDILLVNL